MIRPAAALAITVVLVAGCRGGSGDGSRNVGAEAGLTAVVAAEVAVADPGGGRRWVTINDAEDAARLAATLDEGRSRVPRPACRPDYEISFFLAGGGRVDYAYGCAGEELLWGPDEPWEGEAVRAPAEFTRDLAGYLELLGG